LSYDVIVVGGGPAGLSAALNVRARNKSVLVVTNDYRESPLYRAERIENYLGMPGMTGAATLETFQKHAETAGALFRQGRVLNIMQMNGASYLSIGSDVEEAGAVVLAGGIVRGKKYPGETEHIGRGVSYCATCDGMLYRGKDIVVVGLAPDAAEEAGFLHNLGCHVTFTAPKRPDGLDPEIPYVKGGTLKILGDGPVSALEVGGAVIPCEGVFLLRNAIAPTDLLPGLDLENGYIRVDRAMRTNLPGVFAAGDCTGLPLQISKAVGEGLIAGQKAAEYLDQLEKHTK
jgi:thioredoxin reductase (NADPH)